MDCAEDEADYADPGGAIDEAVEVGEVEVVEAWAGDAAAGCAGCGDEGVYGAGAAAVDWGEWLVVMAMIAKHGGAGRLTAFSKRIQRLADEGCWTASLIDILEIC